MEVKRDKMRLERGIDGDVNNRLADSIVLTMIGLSNSNKTRYQVGCQSRTNACI